MTRGQAQMQLEVDIKERARNWFEKVRSPLHPADEHPQKICPCEMKLAEEAFLQGYYTGWDDAKWMDDQEYPP